MYSQGYSQPPETPPYIIHVDEITAAFIDKIYKEHNLTCAGSGGSMPYDVETIRVNFDSDQNSSIEKARALEVAVTEQLVNMVNAHEKIRPFLREYPFTSERAQIMISFKNKKSKIHGDKPLTLIFQARGKIHYFTDHPETDQYIKILKEPYEEAKQKVLPFIKR